MTLPELTHYTTAPFIFDPTRAYDRTEKEYKPKGLWLSVDSDYGWKEWCYDSEFRVKALKYCCVVNLRADCNLLILRTSQQILDLARRFTRPGNRNWDYPFMHWPSVVDKYQGIVIPTYDWGCRLDPVSRWYYTWDCASGCIWDLSAIESMTQGFPPPEPRK